MGDVADILGLGLNKESSNTIIDETNRILNGSTKSKGHHNANKLNKKPKGMSREVFSLLGKDSFVSTIQGTKSTAAIFKSKRSSAVRGKWIWSTFKNSSRNDNNEVFYHWVKADIQYADYPYAKFNITLDPLSFTDEEYNKLLSHPTWNKEETLHLLELISKYSLKWHVIADRYDIEPYRNIEDLQARYYSIVSKLREHRLGLNHESSTSGSGSGGNSSSSKSQSKAGIADPLKDDISIVFNLEHEKRRKYQLEIAYRK